MPAIYNPIFFKFQLTCTWGSCKGRQEVDQATSAGWKLGDMVPEDPTHPDVGRCPRCKRCLMKVTKAPDDPLPTKPVGWNKIPSE